MLCKLWKMKITYSIRPNWSKGKLEFRNKWLNENLDHTPLKMLFYLRFHLRLGRFNDTRLDKGYI